MSDLNDAMKPPAAPTGTASSEDCQMAMLTHLSCILFGFIGPLVFWLVNKDNSSKAFVTDQAKEALNFQITLTIGYVISIVLSFILIGLILIPIILLVNIIFSIIAGLKAKDGVAYRYPFALRLIS